jgi:hypothetical protein
MSLPDRPAAKQARTILPMPTFAEDRKQVLQLLGWLLLLSTFYVLQAPRPLGGGIDESWKAFLSFAFLARKHFGTEVVFTYGPWGFLIYPRAFPGIFPWMALGRFILAAGCSVGLAALAVRWIQRPVVRAIWASPILLIAEPTYLLLAVLFLLLWPEPVKKSIWQRLPPHLVAFAAGLAANTKFTCFLLLVLLVLPLLLRGSSRWLILTATGSFTFFWLLAGQSFRDLPAFIYHSAALASDYGTAMLFGEVSWPALVIGLSLCGIPALVLLRAEWQRRDPCSLALSCWFFLFEFILFQQTIVRLDAIHLLLGLVLGAFPVALALIPSPDLWTIAGVRRIAVQRSFAGGMLLAGVCAYLYTIGLQQRLPQGADLMTLERQAGTSRSKRTPPTAASGETIGAFPWDLSTALQNSLPLVTPPVIQSYAAFSPRLSALNSQFFGGTRAPGRIYFEVSPIDGRYPTLEDALSWSSLLTHYRPAGLRDGFLLLERRPQPWQFTLQPVLSRDLRPGEAVAVPSGAYPVIWAELRTSHTLWGYLRRLFFRTEELALTVETSSGVHHFTFLKEAGTGGFLLSPWVNSSLAMNDLYIPSSCPRFAEPVRSLSISGPGLEGGSFKPQIAVRLFAFRLEP